jgi:hypothetical protein
VHNWKGDNYLGVYPAGMRVKHRPVETQVHAQFALRIKDMPPEKR